MRETRKSGPGPWILILMVGAVAWILCAISVHIWGDKPVTAFAYRFCEMVMLIAGVAGVTRLTRITVAARGSLAEQAAEETYLRSFSEQIDSTAARLRKIHGLVLFLFSLLGLGTAIIIGFTERLTPFTRLLHWGPGTRFVVADYPDYFHWLALGVIGLAGLFVIVGEGIALLIARAEPIAAQQVFQRDGLFLIRGERRADSVGANLSIALFSLIGFVLAGSLIHSYVRITDRGIAECSFPGLSESFHGWSQVTGVTENHQWRLHHGKGGSNWSHEHCEVVTFSDGTSWRSNYVADSINLDNGTDPAKTPMMQYTAKRSNHIFQRLELPKDYDASF